MNQILLQSAIVFVTAFPITSPQPFFCPLLCPFHLQIMILISREICQGFTSFHSQELLCNIRFDWSRKEPNTRVQILNSFSALLVISSKTSLHRRNPLKSASSKLFCIHHFSSNRTLQNCIFSRQPPDSILVCLTTILTVKEMEMVCCEASI